MKESMQFIREFTVWLHHPLFEYGLFYVDLWSLVHFWSGMILFAALSALAWKNRWKWLFLFLFGFEVVEAFIFISIMKMFMPEKLPDSFTDIFIGLSGGYLIWFLFEKKKINKSGTKFFLFFLASVTISFLWTGNNKFEFSKPMFNTPGINWWIFLCWMLAGIGILFMYEKLKSSKNSKVKTVTITWLAYLTALLILIYGTSTLVNAGEVFDLHSCFFKVVPANRANVFFYFTSPLFFISLYQLLTALFRKYFIKYNIYENE
jgi:hypothetical protein